ncbi:hypothetical protein [Mycolicibacterium sp.]|uniref:hypothetical protein n=1 Tax=Mycolicibacterium sp. TaxID=2320850 RepID=UPI0037C82D71
MNDLVIGKAMRARAESSRPARRGMRRGSRLELVLMVVVLVQFAWLVGWGAASVRQFEQLRAGQPVSAVGPTDAVPALYRVFAGHLSVDTALQVALAAMALCATINVALAIDNATTGLRDPVADSEWRSSLRAAVWVVCAGTLVVTLTAWANITSPEKVGTAGAATLFTIVTMMLTRSVRRQPNSVDRADQFDAAAQRLERLDAWEAELRDRGVRRPLNTGPSGKRWKVVRHYVWALGWRLLAVAGLGVMLLVLLWGAGILLTLLTGEHIELTRPSGRAIAGGLLLQAYITFATAAAAVFLTVTRKWTVYDCKPERMRWPLDIWPRTTWAGYVLLIGAGAALAWLDDGWVRGLYTVNSFITGPVVVAVVLWASRQRPATPWRRNIARPVWVAARPVWEIVWRILDKTRVYQQTRHDELLDQERAEIEQRSPRENASAQQISPQLECLVLDVDGRWASSDHRVQPHGVILINGRRTYGVTDSGLVLPAGVETNGQRPSSLFRHA